MHPDDATRAREFVSASAERLGATELLAWRLLHRDGTWRHVENVGTNLLDEPSVRGLVLNTRDVSERTRIEGELERARDAALESARLEVRVPGQHEPRDSHADERRHRHDRAAARTPTLTPEQRDYAETIALAAPRRCSTIINDILDFSKIEAGKLAFETLDFDLRDGRRGASSELLARDARTSKGLELACLVDRDVPTRAARRPGRACARC